MEILAVEINYYSAPSSRGIDHFFVGFKNMIVVLYLFKLHFKFSNQIYYGELKKHLQIYFDFLIRTITDKKHRVFRDPVQ